MRRADPLDRLLSAFPHARVHVACARCWRRGDYGRDRFVRRYGDMTMRAMLDLVSMSCGRCPDSEHRVGRRDEPCGAHFPDVAGSREAALRPRFA